MTLLFCYIELPLLLLAAPPRTESILSVSMKYLGCSSTTSLRTESPAAFMLSTDGSLFLASRD